MYKAAIIGCGKIAGINDDSDDLNSFYSHAKSYFMCSKIKLIAIADINEKRLEKFGKQWGIERRYKSYKDLLKNEKVDIVSVCTPNKTHYSVLKNIVKIGNPKAVFCEKPMTLSVDHCKEIVQLYKKNNILLVVDHTRRWDPAHIKVKQMITSGELGRIQRVTCYYYKGIIHTGVHLIDFLMGLFGDPISCMVLGLLNPSDVDPTIDARLLFEGGNTCYLIGMDSRFYDLFEIDIVGEKGRIRIEDFGLKFRYWEVGESSEFPGDIELIEHPFPVETGYKKAIFNAICEIVDILEGNKKESGCEAEDVVQVMKAVFWIKSLSANPYKLSTYPKGD